MNERERRFAEIIHQHPELIPAAIEILAELAQNLAQKPEGSETP